MKSAIEKKRKTKEAAGRVVHGLQQFKLNRFKKFDRYQLQPPSLLVVNTNRKCRQKNLFPFRCQKLQLEWPQTPITVFFQILEIPY